MVLRFFLIAVAFLFASCADGERDNPYDPGSREYRAWGSSSSSTATVKNYCVYAELQQCYFGLYSACPGVGGILADSCPYGSSSTSQSSSSAAQSSSSAAMSSSSSKPSSSSSEYIPPPSSSSYTLVVPTSSSSPAQPVSLRGDCVWSKNPTITARGAIPSGVSVVDTDHICPSPSVVYKYAGGAQTWPTTGILSDWKNWDKKHKETYSDVEATLNCPAYSQPVTTLCPALEVSAGADYLIECTGDILDANCGGASKKTVNLKLDECVEINVLGYDNQYLLPTVIMRCESQVIQQSVSVTLSLNGKSTTTSGSYVVYFNVDLGKIKVGDNEFGTLCLTAISGATSVRCVGPSQ